MSKANSTHGGGSGDSGLAQERTELAWSRSGLSVAVAVAAALRRLWPLTGDRSFVALVLIAVGAIVWAMGMQIGRRQRSNARTIRVVTASTLGMLTYGTLILAAAAFLIGLISPA